MKLYVYMKNTKVFDCELVGSIDSLIENISDDKNFTLTPPPDYDHVWRWIDDKWIADQPS